MRREIRERIDRVRTMARTAAQQENRAEQARKNGYSQGYSDRHTTTLDYLTGEEWLAHMEGWRAGQKDLKARMTKGAG